jgi:cytochrome c oxidase subunit 3
MEETFRSFPLQMENKNYIIHPHKFGLWLFILTLIMIFGGLTSAYIVMGSFVPDPDRIFFQLPQILWNNTIVILFSSVTMQFSIWAVKRRQSRKAMIGLVLTFILGLIFLIGQFFAWEQLTEGGLPFVDQARKDNSVSFFYVFTGLHGVHIISGLLVLLVNMIRSSAKGLGHEREVRMFEMTGTFWHFLDLLWVYLFLFLLYTQN